MHQTNNIVSPYGPAPVAGAQFKAAPIKDRAAPRFTLLLRTAKLIVNGKELLCMLRDISATGARVRFYGPVPRNGIFAIEFDDGERIDAELVWQDEMSGGFQFHTTVDVARRLAWESAFPRRALRFAIHSPAHFHTMGQQYATTIINLSAQGGCIVSDAALAIDQPVRLTGPAIATIEARIRWRADLGDGQWEYGLVFDTTFSFDRLAAVLHEFN